jgi:hypothetical protein
MVKRMRGLSLHVCCLLAAVLSCALVVGFWDTLNILPTVRAQEALMGQWKFVEREPNVPEESGPYPCNDVNFPCEAVRVVKVTVGGQEVTPGPYNRRGGPSGVPFLAGDDWLKGLVFTIKNRTSKKIVQVFSDISFPETETTTGSTLAQHIWLGRSPEGVSYTKDGEEVHQGGNGPLDFRGGQEMEISFAPYADEIRKKIEERQPFSTITRCFINVHTAIFEDGMHWILTHYDAPDPGYPGTRKPVIFPGNVRTEE